MSQYLLNLYLLGYTNKTGRLHDEFLVHCDNWYQHILLLVQGKFQHRVDVDWAMHDVDCFAKVQAPKENQSRRGRLSM